MAAAMENENAAKTKQLMVFFTLYAQRTHLENQMRSCQTLYRHYAKNSKRLRMTLRRNSALLARLIALDHVNTKTRIWIHPKTSGWWDTVVPKMPASVWKVNFRITQQTFATLCGRLREKLERKDTNYRKCIPLEKRVAMCVYVLTSGVDLRTVSHQFGVGKSTLCEAVHEFCTSVVNDLLPELIVFPTSIESLQVLVDGFFHDWQFPQTFGALDGCHVEVSPRQDFATYYSNKQIYSTVLLALCDHAYRFMYINAGIPGCNNDASAFSQSLLPNMLSNNPVFRNSAKQVQGFQVEPVILADSAFPLMRNLIKPYQNGPNLSRHQKQFNCQLLTAHNVIKIALTRLKARFRILTRHLDYDINKVTRIIQTCCTLHNLCEIMGDTFEPEWIKENDHEAPEDSTCTLGEDDPSAQYMRNTFSLYLKKVKCCSMMEMP